MEARHLHAVNPETGEILNHCPNCVRLEDQLDGAENNVRSMRAQMANLRRELDGELDKESRYFPEAVALFRYWQERCNHPQAEFTPDRMKIVLPFLKRHAPNASAVCREAIRGAAFDPFITTLKNGNTKRHDGWELIFASEGKMQSFRERAPKQADPTFTQQHLIDHAREVAGRVLERAKLIMEGDDDVAIAHLLIEINRLNLDWRRSVELGYPMEER